MWHRLRVPRTLLRLYIIDAACRSILLYITYAILRVPPIYFVCEKVYIYTALYKCPSTATLLYYIYGKGRRGDNTFHRRPVGNSIWGHRSRYIIAMVGYLSIDTGNTYLG